MPGTGRASSRDYIKVVVVVGVAVVPWSALAAVLRSHHSLILTNAIASAIDNWPARRSVDHRRQQQQQAMA